MTTIERISIVGVLIFPLIFASAHAPEAQNTEEETVLAGRLHVIVGDPPPVQNRDREPVFRYFLTDEEGRTTELLIDEILERPFGGISALDRKRLRIVGKWVGDSPLKVKATSIQLLE